MPIYEAATVEEAIHQGLSTLGITKEKANIDILTEGKKGFLGIGRKNARVSLTPMVSEEESDTVESITIVEEISEEEPLIVNPTNEVETLASENSVILDELDDQAALAELVNYLTEISTYLGSPTKITTEKINGSIVFQLETEKPGILIGKHGKILNALQYLSQVFIHRVAKNKISVVINVGNYRERRQEIVQHLAQRTAEKVKTTGQAVFLEPMPAFERKQIHAVLSKDEYVKTHSEGDEPYRYLVVEPAKKYF